MLKKILAFCFVITFLLFASFANAQKAVTNPSYSSYQNSSAATQIKEFRLPAIVCTIKREPYTPDLISLSVQIKQHLTTDLINDCVEKLKNEKWQYYLPPAVLSASSLRQKDTPNLFCQRVQVIGQPPLYTVSMYSLALTGKQIEMDGCLTLLEEAPELMEDPHKGKKMSMEKEV